MPHRKVQFVELTVQNNVLPLSCGYLHAYAIQDEEISTSFTFSHFSRPLSTPRASLIERLIQADAEIYAFTCYVWNMGVVRWLVDELSVLRPDAKIILGGPQVIGHAHKYLRAALPSVFICNGEGERTFLAFLRAVSRGEDLRAVAGLSFFHHRKLFTTPPADLVADLNEIPSPFLTNIFENQQFLMTVFETNRGCPYQCSFCYWGRGDDLSVRKFREDRIREELEWIARSRIMMLFIGDANWGLLPRDLELSQFIVDCKRRYGFPGIVNFSAAKDKVRRSADIANLFSDAGIITSQAIGIQSMTEVVLEKVRRKNIKLKLLNDVREDLEQKGVGTFTELIWPLPGETLESFKASIGQMCGSNVSTSVVYPGLLLNGTPMEAEAETLGIRTQRTLNDAEETDLIVATTEVSEEDYHRGMWIILSLYVLYNCCAFKHVGRYLHQTRTLCWGDLFEVFGNFLRTRRSKTAAFWTNMLRDRRQSEFAVMGRIVHSVLHEEREELPIHLAEFVRSQKWWNDENVRVLFEADLLSLPYVYSNTPFSVPGDWGGGYPWPYLQCHSSDGRQLSVEIPHSHREIIAAAVGCTDVTPPPRYTINYRRKQFPFATSRTLEENAAYCHGMIQRSASILPEWTAAAESLQASTPVARNGNSVQDNIV